MARAPLITMTTGNLFSQKDVSWRVESGGEDGGPGRLTVSFDEQTTGESADGRLRQSWRSSAVGTRPIHRRLQNWSAWNRVCYHEIDRLLGRTTNLRVFKFTFITVFIFNSSDFSNIYIFNKLEIAICFKIRIFQIFKIN